MTYNPEDPRLTTYALGEMPAGECAEFEASLDDEARAEIEAIRGTASLLQHELGAEATPSLTDTQRTAIHQAVGTVRPRKRRFHWVMWAAAAACFAALVSVMTWPAVSERMKVARQRSNDTAAPAEANTLGLAGENKADGNAYYSTSMEASPEKEEKGGGAGGAPLTYAGARDKYEQALLKDPYDMDAIRGLRKLHTEMEKIAAERRNTIVAENFNEPPWDWNQPIAPVVAAKEEDGKRLAPVPKPGIMTVKSRAAPAERKSTMGKKVEGDVGGGMGGAMGGGMGGNTELDVKMVAATTTPEGKAGDAKAKAPGGGEMGAGGMQDAFGFVMPARAKAPVAPKTPRPSAAAARPAEPAVVLTMQADSGPQFGLRKPMAPRKDVTGARRLPSSWTEPEVTAGVYFGAQARYQPAVPEFGEAKADRGALIADDVETKAKTAETFSREAYDRIPDNPYVLVRHDPLSTFSIDVDTASYANVRRFLTQSQLPPKDAVRIEELVNYFLYNYEEPKGERPFSVRVDLAQCPWAPKHRLARVALKGREPDLARRPASNLVFLLDVSGSMDRANKLPLVKKSMKLLVDHLGENDRVAIVVYAGASGLVLPSTTCDRKEQVLEALDRLKAGGSTNGGSGIQLAYQTAVASFIKGGTNRVILATDGDFNVGVSNRGGLTRLIEEKAKSGVFLTVLGFGDGNLQDAMLEQISGKGNGAYAYIDSVREARKVMVEQIGGTLLTIAKDVKIQVEFNPTRIGAYRLIGYENRILAHQDFNDDKKDAGEIGAGLTVTAFYELVPRGVKIDIPSIDPLKYQALAMTDAAVSDIAMTVKLRYKLPDGDTSTLITTTVKDQAKSIKNMSDDYVFATSVAAFGMVLRDSPYKGSASLALAEELAQTGARRDPNGYRKEFLELVKKAKTLQK